MRKIAFLGVLLIFFHGCRYEAALHDPTKAVSEANAFLRALFIEENYQKALGLGHEELRNSAKPGDLKQLSERIRGQLGYLERLKADSYMQTPGRTMELFYVGTYERGTNYYRIVLMGDTTSGYKVSGVWAKADPYPEHTLRHRFNQNIFVE